MVNIIINPLAMQFCLMNICLFQLRSNEYGIESPGRRMEVLCVRQKEAIKSFVAWGWKINPVRHPGSQKYKVGKQITPHFRQIPGMRYPGYMAVRGGGERCRRARSVAMNQPTRAGWARTSGRNKLVGNTSPLKQKSVAFKPRIFRYIDC